MGDASMAHPTPWHQDAPKGPLCRGVLVKVTQGWVVPAAPQLLPSETVLNWEGGWGSDGGTDLTLAQCSPRPQQGADARYVFVKPN